ncbi:MAG: hypothetical protein CVU05_05740 [Bacteroidetes bacterium HGW-Bacteroidetes-21]|nr:MAG: hypothetical protein CVU05_05740 [Bacteroidetes bacterium HGW-Bacteroidetes-21]
MKFNIIIIVFIIGSFNDLIAQTNGLSERISSKLNIVLASEIEKIEDSKYYTGYLPWIYQVKTIEPYSKLISACESKFGICKTDKNRFTWEKITIDNHDLKLIIRISKWKEKTSKNGVSYYEVKGKLNKALLSGEFYKIMFFLSEDGKCFLCDENNRNKYIEYFQEIVNSIN